MDKTKRKNRASKILLIAILVLLVTSLVGCGLFRTKEKIKDVYIKVSSGLTLVEVPDDEVPDEEVAKKYNATLGKEFVLSASWTKNATDSPDIKWFVAVDENEPIEIESKTTKTLAYKFVNYTTSTYKFSVSANGVQSTTDVTVSIVYAQVEKVEISSTTNNIVQGTLQQNSNSLSEIILVADWNAKNLSPNTICTVEWYVDNIKSEPKEGLEKFAFSYLPTSGGATDIVITVKVIFGEGEGQFVKSSIKVVIVDKYVEVKSVAIEVNSGAQKSVDGIYKQIVGINEYSEVVASISVSPENFTNLNAKVVWTLQSENSVSVLPDNKREIVFIPRFGKNILTATIENVESKSVMIFAMTEAQYSKNSALIEDTFVWNGNLQNAYLSTQEDVNIFVNHIVSKQKTTSGANSPDAHSMFLQPSKWKNGASATEDFRVIVQEALNRLDESGKYVAEYSAVKFSLIDSTIFGIPTEKFETTYTVNQRPAATHFSTVKPRTSLPIDSTTLEMSVDTSNHLFRTVSWGYKPLFATNANGVKLQSIYDKARDVLLTIISDNMTDYQKVLAIYEWIVMEIDYDYALAEDNSTSENKLQYNGFYLEGVFIDKRAVCDGKSKAFALMCGMEGIKSMRIVGRAASSPTNFAELTQEEIDKLTGHAWNKVLIDANGDNIKEWYVVDTTWGDLATQNGKKIVETMSMRYFLASDRDISETHYSISKQPIASTEFDFYKNTFIAGNTSLDITTEAQLIEVLKTVSASGGLAYEVKNSIVDKNVGINFFELIQKVKNGQESISKVAFYVLELDKEKDIYIIFV